MASTEGYVCSLSPELQKKALDELNEKPEWRQRDIQALRDMVVAHKGLKCPTDDAYLLRFLRGKKFEYDRAYQQIISYYTMRAQNVELLGDLRPSLIPECLDSGVSCFLPKRDREGRKIMYFRPGKWDPEKFSLYDMLKINLMGLELVIRDEETQVNGVVLLGNMESVGWAQAKSLERNYFKLMTGLLQEAFPLRFKGIHFINEPSVFGYIFAIVRPFMKEKLQSREAFPLRFKGMHAVREPSVFSYVFSIIKPFLKEKLRSRLNFHGSDLTSVHKVFDPEILPEELGGKLEHGDKIAAAWKQTLLDEEPYLATLKDNTIAVDRQISSGKSGENVECLVGTYRKLNVD